MAKNMRKQHTLTFNEETWTIQQGINSSIYRNGLLTKWYLETETEMNDDSLFDIIGFKLKNEDDGSLIIHCRVKDITLPSIVEIIETIKQDEKIRK